MPDYIYDRLKVPSLDKIEFKKLRQLYSYKDTTENGGLSLESLNHLQLQVDHLEGTNFVQVCAGLDWSENNSFTYNQFFCRLCFRCL